MLASAAIEALNIIEQKPGKNFVNFVDSVISASCIPGA